VTFGESWEKLVQILLDIRETYNNNINTIRNTEKAAKPQVAQVRFYPHTIFYI